MKEVNRPKFGDKLKRSIHREMSQKGKYVISKKVSSSNVNINIKIPSFLTIVNVNSKLKL